MGKTRILNIKFWYLLNFGELNYHDNYLYIQIY